MSDQVDHPQHYQGNGLEVIDVIEAFDLGFSLGNAVKYILRAGKKGNPVEDLEKAIWYLQRDVYTRRMAAGPIVFSAGGLPVGVRTGGDE